MLTRKSPKLNVNQLEDRWVPAILDLTTAGSFGQVGDGVYAQFSGTSNVPTDTFLSIDGSGGTEQGYNTDNVSEFDEVASHSIRVSNLPVVTLSGAEYVEFLLDVQEGNNKTAAKVSLDDVAVFVGPVGNLTSFTALSGGGVALNGLPAKYHLDSVGGTDNGVLIDGKLSGRTGADMLFYLPKSLLTYEGEADPYVYLYSRFGLTSSAGGKSENWSHGVGGPISPSTAATIDASGLITPPPPPVVPAPPPPTDDTGTGDTGGDTGTGGDDGTVWL